MLVQRLCLNEFSARLRIVYSVTSSVLGKGGLITSLSICIFSLVLVFEWYHLDLNLSWNNISVLGWLLERTFRLVGKGLQ